MARCLLPTAAFLGIFSVLVPACSSEQGKSVLESAKSAGKKKQSSQAASKPANKYSVTYVSCPKKAGTPGYDDAAPNVDKATADALAKLNNDCGSNGEAELTFIFDNDVNTVYDLKDGKATVVNAIDGLAKSVEDAGANSHGTDTDHSAQNIAANTPSPMPTNSIFIRNYATNKCIEIGGGVVSRGQPANQWDCIGGQLDYQHWNLEQANDGYWVIKRHDLADGKAGTPQCLEIGGGTPANGATANQYDCVAGEPNQMWKIDVAAAAGNNAIYKLVNKATGKCLEVPGADNEANTGSFQNGVTLSQWDCSGSANQTWSLLKD